MNGMIGAPRWTWGAGAVSAGRLAFVGIALAACTACDAATTPVAPHSGVATAQGLDGNPTGWDLPLMSAGQLSRAVPGRPCASASHREFDFWLGDWNINPSPTGQVGGTNSITSELDGCLVLESYRASGGVQGSSLNVFDRETGLWNQTWAFQIPGAPIGRLRTSGGIVDGMMVLDGTRDASFRGDPFLFEDEWTWTPTPEGDVIQTGRTFAGPPFDQVLSSFTGRYVRADISPAPALPAEFCNEKSIGAPTRDGDFLVGDWRVRGERGPQLATSSVEAELGRCLLVERFEGKRGLRAVAWMYWDIWTNEWYYAWVDTRGERLELSGEYIDGSLVFTGAERLRGADVEVRLTWAPADGGLHQMWEVSRDGGATWSQGAELHYTPM